VRIEETESLYLAQPAWITRDPDGSFYISDGFWNRVVQVERNGHIRTTLGRAGSGPGETRTLGLAFRANDTTIVVVDNGRRLFNLFSTRTRTFLRARSHEGIVRSAVRVGNKVWLGAQNMRRRTSVMSWDLSSDSLAFLVPLPVEYLRSEPLRNIYTGVSIAPWGDTVLVGLQGLSSLELVNAAGAILDTIDIPSRHRRSVPGDVAQALSPAVRPRFEDLFSALSALVGLHRRSDGSFVLVHADAKIKGRLVTQRLFVSVLSPDRSRACVDRELVVSQDAAPVVTFSVDTLFVVEQRMVSAGSTEAYLKSYTINTDSCAWLPIK
jgi:hypothetical protein